jgi:hypothetical protein
MSSRFFLLSTLWVLSVGSTAAQDAPAGCGRAEASAILDVGDIRAGIYPQGNLFYGGAGGIGFEVPKGSGMHAHFSDVFLLGGMVDGGLRVSGSTYSPWELWPGPLDDHGKPAGDCTTHDRIWEARAPDDLDPEVLTRRVLDWPAHLGAPYTESDGIPGYTPAGGDRPLFHGEQAFWSLSNDVAGTHVWSKSEPLHIEVASESWASNDGLLKHVTFHRYVVTNKNTLPIRDMYVGRFVDVDLGNAWDDLVGSDTTLSMMYFYTRSEEDGMYGSPAPAIGLIGLEARHSVDPLPSNTGAGPESFFTTVITPDKGGGPHSSPDNAAEFYSYLRGIWRNGDPLVAGGYGWPGSLSGRGIDIPVSHIYPGDPVAGGFWTQMDLDGLGTMASTSDKRGIVSFGPFDLEPDEWAAFTYAYVWARGDSFLDSITKVKQHARVIHSIRESMLAYSRLDGVQFIDGNPPEAPQYPFWVDEPYPNPASDRVTLSMSLTWDAPVMITVHDMLGRERHRATFEGQPGPVTQRVDVSSLPPGVYLIRVTQRGAHRDSPLTVL